jgi:hypothetical protein
VSGQLLPLLVFIVAVAVVAVVGIGLGMLLAPRIGRWADHEPEPQPEDAGGDDD